MPGYSREEQRSLSFKRIMAGPSKWLVSVPVWGQRYEEVFKRCTLPALIEAADKLEQEVTLCIYTDDPSIASDWAKSYQLKSFGVPGPDRSFMSLSAAHRHTLSMADGNTRILLLTADMVVSSNVFQTCNAVMRAGKRCVCVASMRVVEGEELPPWQESRKLLEWGWARRHKITDSSLWPQGTSYDVSRMYFTNGADVVARLCLPHPIAVWPYGPRRPLQFKPTIDVNLVNNFPLREIYLVTSPDEASVIELSPPEKEFLVTEPMQVRFSTRGPSLPAFTQLRSIYQRHFFAQAVVIQGQGGAVDDGEVMTRLLHNR